MTDDFKAVLEFPGFASDRMSKMRAQYLAGAHERSNTRYGWVRA
jgi:hypothetical protein